MSEAMKSELPSLLLFVNKYLKYYTCKYFYSFSVILGIKGEKIIKTVENTRKIIILINVEYVY